MLFLKFVNRPGLSESVSWDACCCINFLTSWSTICVQYVLLQTISV